MNPLVSVIIPAFNANKYIARTLDSVVSQTYHNLEILVIDDGSTDQTADIVRDFITKDQRIQLLQQSNSGVAEARNLGIKCSHGCLIAPIDADDVWMPENIEKQVESMLCSPPTVGMVYAWSFNIDEADNLTGGFHVAWWKGDVYLPLICRNFVGNASAVLIRRSCFDKIGGYDSSLRKQDAQGCEDLDLYLRIAASYQVNLVPDFLVGYRQVRGSMSRNFHVMEKSQQLTLKSLGDRNLSLYQKLKPWTMRNFYAYLGYQSHHDGQFKESQQWFSKALKEDFVMTLLSHDFYVLSALNFIYFNFQKKAVSQASLSMSSRSRFKAFFLRKETLLGLAIVKECLPARVYERFRINRLLSQNSQALALTVGRNIS